MDLANKYANQIGVAENNIRASCQDLKNRRRRRRLLKRSADATSAQIVYTIVALEEDDVGKKIWEFEGKNKLINSQRRKSLILNNDNVIFNNTNGELIALNRINGNLLWITPTVSYTESIKSFLLNT